MQPGPGPRNNAERNLGWSVREKFENTILFACIRTSFFVTKNSSLDRVARVMKNYIEASLMLHYNKRFSLQKCYLCELNDVLACRTHFFFFLLLSTLQRFFCAGSIA